MGRLTKETGWTFPDGTLVVFEEESRGGIDWVLNLPGSFAESSIADDGLEWVSVDNYDLAKQLIERYLGVQLPVDSVPTADAFGERNGWHVKLVLVKLKPRQCMWIQLIR
jgi:hypothetical protein